MLSVTTIIVLCVGGAAMIAFGIFLSGWDAKRHKTMSGQENKAQEKENENEAGTKNTKKTKKRK